MTPGSETGKTPIVRMRDVRFSYDGQSVLEGIDLDVYEDDFLGLVGPNGGGKTTLVKLMLGLLTPDHGSIEIFGQSPKRVRTKLGYVPQYAGYETDFPATVREFVLMGRLGHVGLGRPFRREDREAAARAMDRMGISHLAERGVQELSGGERQRMLVARALATEPRLLLLDEPTVSVDVSVEENFFELLQQLNRDVAIVLVSHDVGFISKYLTRVACLNRRIVVAPVDEIRARDLEAIYETPVKAWTHDCDL